MSVPARDTAGPGCLTVFKYGALKLQPNGLLIG
jgi:hypothetical protein